MKQISEWLMKPMVKINVSIPQGGISTHKSSIEYDLALCYPLSSKYHDSLYHGLIDQSTPPTKFSHSLDFQVDGPNCDQG